MMISSREAVLAKTRSNMVSSSEFIHEMEVLNQVAHFSGYGATGCWKVQTPVDGALKSLHIK